MDVPCGNGVLDEGEQCDDGNEVDGDGCNHDCADSGTLIWEVDPAEGLEAYDESASTRRQRLGVAPDGSVLALARVNVGPDSTRVPLIARYSTDGTLEWSTQWSGAGVLRVPIEIEAGSGGDFLASIVEVPEGQNVNRGVLRRFDASGTEQWTSTYDQDQYVVVGGIAAEDNGDFLVAGYVTGDGPLSRMVRRLSAAGRETLAFDGVLPAGVYVHAVRRAANGDFIVCIGSPPDGGSNNDGTIISYGPDGTERWMETYPGVDLIQCALHDDGSIALVGDQGGVSWAAMLNGDGAVEWSLPFEGVGSATLSSVAFSSTGGVITAGTIVVPAADGDNEVRWLRRFDAAGNLSWERQLDFSEGEDESIADVGVDGDDNIYAVGRRDVVEGARVWLAKFTP